MKSISPGTVTIGVIAIVFGLVGVYVARRALEPSPVPTLKAPPPARAKPGPSVVFARVNLPAKTRITYRDLTMRRLGPGEEPPAGSVASEAEMIGRITRNAVRAGSVMMDEELFDIGEGPNPADLIPAGYVAVPIKATGQRVGDGLLRMGAHVNISGTVESDELDRGLVSTRTLLENVLVIATGPEDFERPSPTLTAREMSRIDRVRNETDEITVAVPQAQANMLRTAQQFGSLSVTLCSFDGASQGGESVATAKSIFDIPDAPVPPPVETVVVAPPAPPTTYTIERWNGTSMELITLPASRIREAEQATVADKMRGGGTVPVGIRGPE